MKKISLILATLLISYVSFGQITKKMPYIFDNTVTLNDSLKIGALVTYGEFMKADSAADGTLFMSSAVVHDEVTSLSYDSITDAPFSESASSKWYSTDSAETYSFGGINDTSQTSVFAKYGIARGVYVIDANINRIRGEDGDIFITSANSGATNITDVEAQEQGRYITIIGGSSTNPTTISSGGNIILSPTLADPVVMSEGMAITFITYWRAGQIYALELSRNQ